MMKGDSLAFAVLVRVIFIAGLGVFSLFLYFMGWLR